jgi:hypothetical protein
MLLWTTPTALALADTAQTSLGARATAMAGAYTAVADDATAFYWNPAGVARGPFVRVGGFWGDSYEDRGELIDHLRSQTPGDEASLVGDRAWGFATGITVLGVAVSRFTFTDSVMDGSDIQSRGLTTWDVAVTFVQSLPPDDLIVGVNVRYIRGTAYADTVPMTDFPEGQRDVKDVVDRTVSGQGRSGSQPGVDLGVVYQPTEWLRLGFTARNLNRPTFQTEGGEDISLERHARAGGAFLLPRDLVVAIDFDLASRDYAPGGRGWRELAAGVEKSWANQAFTLRGGLRSEVGDLGWTRPGFTGGVGVRYKDVSFDIAAMTSTQNRLGALWFGVTFQR